MLRVPAGAALLPGTAVTSFRPPGYDRACDLDASYDPASGNRVANEARTPGRGVPATTQIPPGDALTDRRLCPAFALVEGRTLNEIHKHGGLDHPPRCRPAKEGSPCAFCLSWLLASFGAEFPSTMSLYRHKMPAFDLLNQGGWHQVAGTGVRVRRPCRDRNRLYSPSLTGVGSCPHSDSRCGEALIRTFGLRNRAGWL